MTLDDVRKCYQDSSKQAGDVGRTLSFAGIAVVWIFKTGDGSAAAVPAALIPALFCFATSLGLDLAQYLAASAIWGYYGRHQEKWLHENGDAKNTFRAPTYLNWPAIAFFWLKSLSVVVGQVLLIAFLVRRWNLLP
jgi:hypothetical protein